MAKKPPSFTPVLVAALVIVAIGIGSAWYLQRSDAVPASTEVAAAAPVVTEVDLSQPPANAKFGPHKQATLPPLVFPGYGLQRPEDVVRSAYNFAAEHPEVLGYVPCFCGCQRMGHRGNDDCFVAARTGNGDVAAWEPHGMECLICIDVAHQSETLFKEGKSIADIRAAVERAWTPKFPTHTPTPMAPKGN